LLVPRLSIVANRCVQWPAAFAAGGWAACGAIPGVCARISLELSKSSNLSKMDKEVAMRHVSATDAKQRLAALLDAAQHEPVVIRRQKRDVAVLLSPREYDRLRALNAGEFQQFCDRIGRRAAARGLTESKLARLLNDEIPPARGRR
jgi:prevent-host-death family protein